MKTKQYELRLVSYIDCLHYDYDLDWWLIDGEVEYCPSTNSFLCLEKELGFRLKCKRHK